MLCLTIAIITQLLGISNIVLFRYWIRKRPSFNTTVLVSIYYVSMNDKRFMFTFLLGIVCQFELVL